MTSGTTAVGRRTLTRVTAPLVALRAAGQALEFLGFVLLARRLGTEDFGIVSVAFLVCRYGGLVADWGASLKGARDVAAGRSIGDVRALVRRRTRVSLALVAAFCLGAAASGNAAVVPLALTIGGRGVSRDWLALGRERAVRSGLPPALQGALVALGAVLATSVATASLAIGLAYAAAAATSVCLNRLPSQDGEGSVSRSAADPWFLVLIVADQVYASADVILISLLLSASDAGIYAAVYRFPNAAVTIIGLVVTSLVPGLSRAVTNGASFSALRRRALGVGRWCGAGVVASIPLAWVLVPLVFGDAYLPGRGPLVLLLLATALPAATIGLQPLYFAAGDERHLAVYAVGIAIVSIGLDLLIIPRYGLVGAASVTLMSQALVAAFYVTATRRLQEAS